MSKYGLVYIVSNSEQNKDLYKIGKTSRTIDERIKELNSATGTLGKFQAHATFLVEDIDFSEKDIHKKLSKLRYQSNREFFKCNYTELLVKVRDLIAEDCLKENLITQPDKKILKKINSKKNKEDREFLISDFDMDKLLEDSLNKTKSDNEKKEKEIEKENEIKKEFSNHQHKIFKENFVKLKKSISKYKFINFFLTEEKFHTKCKIIISPDKKEEIEKSCKHHLKFFKPYKSDWGGIIVNFYPIHGGSSVGELKTYYRDPTSYDHQSLEIIYNLTKVFKYLIEDLAKLIIKYKEIKETNDDFARQKKYLINNALGDYRPPYVWDDSDMEDEDEDECRFKHNDCDFEHAMKLYLKLKNK